MAAIRASKLTPRGVFVVLSMKHAMVGIIPWLNAPNTGLAVFGICPPRCFGDVVSESYLHSPRAARRPLQLESRAAVTSLPAARPRGRVESLREFGVGSRVCDSVRPGSPV